MIIKFKNKTPRFGKNVFIAPTSVIIGDVEIGDNAGVWYGAVIRGDLASVRIGERSNIQDNCIIHTDEGFPVTIGNVVTVGHHAVIHGCTVENNCLIGINSVVLNGALIKTGSVVAAGSVVKENQVVGPYHLVAGIPAKLKKEMSDTIVGLLEEPAKIYVNLANEYLNMDTLGEDHMLNIYAALWCPHCQDTVEFLKNKNIPFNYIDIEKQPDDVVKKVVDVNGGDDWVVPTLEYNGKWREGKVFDPNELMSDLQKLGVIF